jgi:hypothetical protein
MAWQVDGLAGTDPDVDGAGGDAAIALGVDEGEFAGSQREDDDVGGVRVEVDALEAGERTDGSAFDVGMGDVEFDDLVAGDVGGIGDANGHGDGGVAGERRTRSL